MAKTKLTIDDVQTSLNRLGYYDGPFDLDPMSDEFRTDLKRFQRDHQLNDDGWYGPKTEGKLLPLHEVLTSSLAPPDLRECRRWRLTYYYVGGVAGWKGPLVPMRTPAGELIARVPAGAFAEAALQGSSKLADGRMVNVAHPAYSACDPVTFQPVYDIAKRNGWVPEKPGYAGILLTADHKRARASRNFHVVDNGPKGWPVCAKNIECDPFRTLAADNGRLGKHDSRFKGQGGVVPAGTRVWILELVGKKLPDGTVHDGWCVVNDTGGGIYGAHFDVFTGTKQIARKVSIPGLAHIWFEGVEERLGINYSYGL